jgi:hypothetical protein
MEMIQSLSLTELKSFNKHTYKEMMIPQMKKLLTDISDTIISSTCHYKLWIISIYSLLIEFSIVNILDLAAGDKRNSAPSSDPDMLK